MLPSSVHRGHSSRTPRLPSPAPATQARILCAHPQQTTAVRKMVMVQRIAPFVAPPAYLVVGNLEDVVLSRQLVHQEALAPPSRSKYCDQVHCLLVPQRLQHTLDGGLIHGHDRLASVARGRVFHSNPRGRPGCTVSSRASHGTAAICTIFRLRLLRPEAR